MVLRTNLRAYIFSTHPDGKKTPPLPSFMVIHTSFEIICAPWLWITTWNENLSTDGATEMWYQEKCQCILRADFHVHTSDGCSDLSVWTPGWHHHLKATPLNQQVVTWITCCNRNKIYFCSCIVVVCMTMKQIYSLKMYFSACVLSSDSKTTSSLSNKTWTCINDAKWLIERRI